MFHNLVKNNVMHRAVVCKQEKKRWDLKKKIKTAVWMQN